MQCSFVSIKKCQISPFNDDEKLILSPRRCDHVWLPKFPNNVKVKMWRNITSVGETSPELLIGGTEQNPLVISLAFSGCKTYLEIIIFFSDYVHQTKTNETKGKNVTYAYLHLKVFHELKEYIQMRWYCSFSFWCIPTSYVPVSAIIAIQTVFLVVIVFLFL